MLKKLDTVNPYLLLAISIALEVSGATSLKASAGFSVIAFGIATYVLYGLSLLIFSVALKRVSLGLAYGIWGGVGTTATALIGVVVWNDPFSWTIAVGIVLIVGGIALMSKGTEEIET